MVKKERDNYIPTKSYNLRFVDIKNIKPGLKKEFEQYGKCALLEFDNGFGIFIAKKKGLHFAMPKEFFKEQIKDESNDLLEVTFTPDETNRIFDMLGYYVIGTKYKNELKKKGWSSQQE